MLKLVRLSNVGAGLRPVVGLAPIALTLKVPDRPAWIRPACHAIEASAQVGYKPLLLSQATISIVATGASAGTLLRLAVTPAMNPAAAPVRNVVGAVDAA